MPATLQCINFDKKKYFFIEKIYLFKGTGKKAGICRGIIVPDGKPKLIIPLQAEEAGFTFMQEAFSLETDKFIITGILLKSIELFYTGSLIAVVIVLHPHCLLFSVFSMHKKHINAISFSDEFSGKRFSDIFSLLQHNISRVHKAVINVVDVLFAGAHPEEAAKLSIIFCAVSVIAEKKGCISISELSSLCCCTKRYMAMLFRKHFLISPKKYCSVIKFYEAYSIIIKNSKNDRTKNQFLDYYYDQSHFIRTCRHFTNVSPVRLIDKKSLLSVRISHSGR